MENILGRIRRLDEIESIKDRTRKFIDQMKEKNAELLNSETTSQAKEELLKFISSKEKQIDSYADEVSKINSFLKRLGVTADDYRKK